MEGQTAAYSCPLCCQANFPNIDSLKLSLVKVTSRPLSCPICSEVVMGLDKLTIHLFAHSVLSEDQIGPKTDDLKLVRKPRMRKKDGRKLSTEKESSSSVTLAASSSTSSSFAPVVIENRVAATKDSSVVGVSQQLGQQSSRVQEGNRPNEIKNKEINDFVDETHFKQQQQGQNYHVVAPQEARRDFEAVRPPASVDYSKSPQGEEFLRAIHSTDFPRASQGEDFAGNYQGQDYSTTPQSGANTSLQSKSETEQQGLNNYVATPQTPVQFELQLLPSFRCDTCDLQFHDNSLLAMHQKLFHEAMQLRDDSHKFQCHLCFKSFKMKGSLRIHLRVAHYGFHFRFNDDQAPHCSSTEPVVVFSPQANIFASPLINTDNCGTGGGNGGELPQQQKIEGNVCDICSKSFTTKYFLKKHKRLHTGEMPYSCNICGKTFTFQQSYHKHLLYHSDEKPHVCPTCGRAFKELSTLHNHERIHSGEKPFKCETCGKCFRQRVSYLVHRRIHTGVMPYRCTACGKSFRYKVSQRTHKCTAQPPGTVIRQTGDLLQRLLQSAAIFASPSDGEGHPEEHHEDLISKSLDDFVNESCNKMGILENLYAGESSVPTVDNNVPSPSEGMQNLCLMSPAPGPCLSHGRMNGIHVEAEDAFRHFFV